MQRATKKVEKKRLVRYKEGAEMYSMGMNKFQTLAKDAGAILKIDDVAKMGRPKSANPKNTLIGLKLTEEEATKLREYASKHDMTVTEVLQKGIDLQYAMEDSQRS